MGRFTLANMEKLGAGAEFGFLLFCWFQGFLDVMIYDGYPFFEN